MAYKKIKKNREVVKKRSSYSPADRKGGGVQPLALTASKCENFGPFFSSEIWFFDTPYTFYLIVRGLKDALYASAIPLSDRFVTEQQQQGEPLHNFSR